MEPGVEQVEGLQLLLDKQAIREVLFRYCRGIDRVQPDLTRDAYHPDSRDFHGTFSGTGAEFAGDSMAAELRDDPTNIISHHMLGQSLIEIEGDIALSETYFVSTGIRLDDAGRRRTYRVLGRYLDRITRVDRQWRILTRRALVDLSDESPEGDAWAPGASYTPGRRWPDDAVFDFDRYVSHAPAPVRQ